MCRGHDPHLGSGLRAPGTRPHPFGQAPGSSARHRPRSLFVVTWFPCTRATVCPRLEARASRQSATLSAPVGGALLGPRGCHTAPPTVSECGPSRPAVPWPAARPEAAGDAAGVAGQPAPGQDPLQRRAGPRGQQDAGEPRGRPALCPSPVQTDALTPSRRRRSLPRFRADCVLTPAPHPHPCCCLPAASPQVQDSRGQRALPRQRRSPALWHWDFCC